MSGGSIELEARAYGPDSTPEELEAIRARVTLHDEHTLMWRELPVMTVFTVDAYYDRLEELSEAHGCRNVIVDSREGARPDAAIRKRLYDRTVALADKMDHIALVILANPILRVAARFIQAALPVEMSVHSSIAEAEEALRRGKR